MGRHRTNHSAERERLAALAQYDILDTSPERAFDSITQLAAELFEVPVALTGFIEESRHWFKARVGTQLSENPRNESFCDRTIAQPDVLVVPDALEDERFRALPVVQAGLVRFYAGAPLITPTGQAVGTLCLLDPEPKPGLDREHRNLLSRLAGLVMDELELRRVTREALEAHRALAAREGQLRAVVEHAVDTIYIKDLEGRYLLVNPNGLQWIGKSAAEVIGCSDRDLLGAELARPLAENDRQVVRTGRALCFEERVLIGGEAREVLSNKVPYRGADGEVLGVVGITRDVTEQKQAGRELAQRNSLLKATLDATNDAILSVDLAGRVTGCNQQFLSMWRVPEALIGKKDDKRLLAHARRQLRDTRVFDARLRELRDDDTLVTHDLFELNDDRVIERHSLPQQVGEEIVGRVWSFRDVTLQKRAEARMTEANEVLEARVAERTKQLTEANRELHALNEQQRHDAFYDGLTGLPNRSLLLDRLTQALERRQNDQRFALLHLDFDRFRHINTSLGREVGDAVLQRIARRLGSCLRPADTLARLGADEFVLLAEGVKSRQDAERLAERVTDAFITPVILGEHEVHLMLNIGVVMGDAGYLRPEEALRDADIALARAKSLGKSRYAVFTPELRARADSRRSLEADLRRALERDEFEVYYQPIVALQSERLLGFEALLRWQHPQHGLVSPAEFIPIAEDSGLITDLDRWVLAEASRQVANWRGLFGLPLSLSVNVSAQQFDRDDLHLCVAEALEASGLRAENLRLELTESLLLEDSQSVCRQLHELKDLGVQLYIDDFGTGYSSLAYLQRFPVDTIKIDRSFVDRMLVAPEGVALIESMLGMARSLGLDVVAEGVETREQLLALRQLGCHYGQGYLFGRPVGAAATATFMQHQLACVL